MKKILIVLAALAVFISVAAASVRCEEATTLNLTKYKDAKSLKTHEEIISRVKLSGKICRFGVYDYHAIVPNAQVWVAEYPESKKLDIRSDAAGWWTLNVIKYKGKDDGFSFVYEKEGWITTKSNVIAVTDQDNTDLAIQFIDPDVFRNGMKPLIGLIMMSAKRPAGAGVKFRNAMVTTVGKSWASMHDDRLPHGEPGATVTIVPGAVGPLYFNEKVMPDPAYPATSVDGGVAWLNVPKGEYSVTAAKEGLTFATVKFVIDAADAANGIVLYIASPPDAIQGSNTAEP
ncbi:MAG: hypothetical protein WCX65_05560 [bacterium]